MEPKKNFKTGKQIGQRDYPPEIENLWNDLILLYEKELNRIQNFRLTKWYSKFISYSVKERALLFLQ